MSLMLLIPVSIAVLILDSLSLNAFVALSTPFVNVVKVYVLASISA